MGVGTCGEGARAHLGSDYEVFGVNVCVASLDVELLWAYGFGALMGRFELCRRCLGGSR